MALQHFFSEGRYLGSRTIQDNRVVPGLDIRRHHSYVLFCPRCGEVWGRVLHVGAEYTECNQRFCLKHGDGRIACPPAWFDWPTRFESDWPSAAIRWEFEATLRYAEKEEV